MKRPQALNSPGSLQIKKKDELDEYYDGDGNISIDNKQLWTIFIFLYFGTLMPHYENKYNNIIG